MQVENTVLEIAAGQWQIYCTLSMGQLLIIYDFQKTTDQFLTPISTTEIHARSKITPMPIIT